MNEVLIAAGFGIAGGLTRFLITSLKTMQFERKISFEKLSIYAVVLIFIGAFSGIILGYGNAISFLGGYAGLDLMDGYYREFKKKKIKFM